MSSGLLSKDWYRVAGLQPRLRPQVDVSLHHYHGQPSYILYDRVSGQSFRTSASTYDILKDFDGTKTVNEIWHAMAQENRPDLPPQDELIEFLGRMYESNLLTLPSRARPRRLYELQKKHSGMWWKQLVKSPISQRIPILDPRPILNRTTWISNALFSQIGGYIFLLLMFWAGTVAVDHWDELTNNVADRMLAPDNLLLMILVYPTVKLLHEFGHAWCVRRFGGDVTEMGIMFLFFIPIPYVDATQSNIFPQHSRRALVALAGVLTELGIGATCLIIWSELDPGVGRALAYNAVIICTISSIFFNGNPLLRFDAYYVLADLTQTPNLGNRGNAIWGEMLRDLLKLPERAATENASRSHRLYMATYALCAFCYRVFITFSIVLLLLEQYPLVGQALAIWAVYGSFLHPIGKGVMNLKTESKGTSRPRVLLRFSAMLLLLVVLVFLVPLPKATVVEGIISNKYSAAVAARSEGTTLAVLTNSGDRVKSGQLVMRLTPERLISEAHVLRAQVEATEAKMRAQRAGRESGLSEVLREELQTTQASLERINEQINAAEVAVPSAGVWVWRGEPPEKGAFIHRGQVLGTLDTVGNRRFLGTTDAYYLSDMNAGVISSAWVAESAPADPRPLYEYSWLEQPTTALPDPRLASQNGGHILSEPGEKQGEVFSVSPQLVVEALGPFDDMALGTKVILRLKHEPEPIAPRLWRWLNRTFLGLVGA